MDPLFASRTSIFRLSKGSSWYRSSGSPLFNAVEKCPYCYLGSDVLFLGGERTESVMTSILIFLSCFQVQPVVSAAVSKPPLGTRIVAQGTLNAKIVIIDELKPYPVAFSNFQVIGPEATTIQDVRTNANGEIDLRLEPGLYAFLSKEPIPFQGKTYEWNTSFEISSDKRTDLTLTHTDALVEVSKEFLADKNLSPESKLYRRFRNSVVTVECDSGSGSAFVVDREMGLLLTSFHVAGTSQFLSVRFGRQNHYEARFVMGDASSDVAVIRVNPMILRDVPVINLHQSRHVGIEGERVVAMGSPLFQQTTITQGILSRVEDDVLISDVRLDKGNSGGPILNLEGNAIGIATYGDLNRPGGEGTSTIVSIRKADKLIRTLGALADDTLPSAAKLPDNSPVSIPPDMLEQTTTSIRGEEPFLKSPKNFRTFIRTPFEANLDDARYRSLLKEKIARRYQGQVPTDQNLEFGPLFFWNKYVGNQFEPVVSIEVIPWSQETSGSLVTRAAGAILGQKIARTHELRDDFSRMVLLRNGVEVTPILRKRLRNTKFYDERDQEMRDTALSGFYTYEPKEFRPGSKLELQVWKNGDIRPVVMRVPVGYQERIWRQFTEWSRLGG